MGCGASTQPDNSGSKKKKKKGGSRGGADVGSETGTGETAVVPAPVTKRPAPESSDDSSDERDSMLSSISEVDESPLFPAFVPTHMKDIGQQREESSAFNIETEYFIWDDASVDVKELRNRESMKKSFIRGKPAPAKGAAAPGPRSAQDKAFVWGDFQVDPEMESLPQLASRGSMRKDPSTSTATKPPKEPAATVTKAPTSPQSPNRAAKKAKRSGGISNFKLTTLVGHSSRVKCIAVAPSESEFVSCSNEDSLVTYYDLRSGNELGIFSGHQDTVIFACFSPCGKFLATTSRDNTLMLWDVVTQKVILTFEHSKVVICCSFSKDSKLIATGCQDKVCRLWETRKGRELLAFTQHEGIIISLSFSPDEAHIVSCSADKTLRMWTTTKGKSKLVMRGHSAIILSCQYSVDGKKIVSNDERLAKVWNAADGSCLLTLNVETFVTIRNMPPTKKLSWTLSCTCPGRFANYFVVACNNRFVFVIDMETGKEELCVDTKAPVYCLTSGHNSVVAFGDSFGNVYQLRLFGFPEEP